MPNSNPVELDIRIVSPRAKPPPLLRPFDALKNGESFVLVNDHDPAPLRYQFEATRTGQYTWEYLEAGPVVWRVSIGKN